MNRFKFRPGQHFWLKGREYIIKTILANGELQICEVVTEVLSKIASSTLVQFFFQGELEIQPPPNSDTFKKKRDYGIADFTQISDELRSGAKRKYSYVKEAIERDLATWTSATLQPIIEQVAVQINDPNPPNWLTLYRWLKTYESAGNDIRALIPKHFSKGDYRPKLHPLVIQIIESSLTSIYLKTLRPDIADVYDEIIRQITQENNTRAVIGQKNLEIPHRSTIYRFASKLEPNLVATGRYGARIASQMYDPVMLGPRPERPLERIEIDHTKLPLFVVDTERRMPIGTPWLTSAVDKYSGVTLGYYASFDPPSYLSVMQCLLHAIRPKNYLTELYPSVVNTWDTYGLPEVIVVDNGKEFYSTHFEDACLSLGIAIQYSPPKMPWYKSAIERYFGAVNTQLLSNIPGKSFSNFMKRHDYDPLKNAVISFEALQEILHIFIVDIHNQSSHPQFKKTREAIWSTAIKEFPPALPSSNQELKVLIGNITTRKITRRGVEFEGLIYNSLELSRLRSESNKSEKTTVKYDPTDLSQIYVFDSRTHQFLSVPAICQEYTKGLSLWQHQVIKQLARTDAETIDIVALILAKEKIQKIVEQEWALSKKGKTRATMARWKGVGREEFNTVKFESYLEEQPLDNNIVTTSNYTHSSDVQENKVSVMSGISDIGSAFNNEQELAKNEGARAKNELLDNNQNLEISKIQEKPINQKKQKRSSSQKSAQKVTEVVDFTAENSSWKPDLSGWDVSIGLPS